MNANKEKVMRKLLVCLLFVPMLSQAETIATMPNAAGGKIVLTNEVCKYSGKTYDSLRRMYNYSESGYTAEGCYAIEDETITSIWINKDGSTSKMRYPAQNFTIKQKTSGST